MSYVPVTKDVLPSIKLVTDLLNTENYTVKLASHYLHERVFEVSKTDRQYSFNASSKIQKGVQTHKEIQFERNDVIELKGKANSLFVQGKYLLLNNINYDFDNNLKLFSGSINSFSSSAKHDDINNKYLRMVIPDLSPLPSLVLRQNEPSLNIHLIHFIF